MGLSAPPDAAARWSIIIDARLTRRKYYHCVITPSERVAFRSKHLGECIDWLRAEGVANVDLLQAETTGKDRLLAATLTVKD